MKKTEEVVAFKFTEKKNQVAQLEERANQNMKLINELQGQVIEQKQLVSQEKNNRKEVEEKLTKLLQ